MTEFVLLKPQRFCAAFSSPYTPCGNFTEIVALWFADAVSCVLFELKSFASFLSCRGVEWFRESYEYGERQC